MRDIMVLAKDTSQIAAGEEDSAGSVMALDAGFFAEVRGDCADADGVAGDEAGAGAREAVYGAATRAEVAVAEVRVGGGAFEGGGAGV